MCQVFEGLWERQWVMNTCLPTGSPGTVALLSDVASLRMLGTGAFEGNGSDVYLLFMLLYSLIIIVYNTLSCKTP